MNTAKDQSGEPGGPPAEETGPVSLESWVEHLSAELDLDPKSVPIAELLDLARDAAHGITRPAAPVTTYVAGLLAGIRGGGTADVDAVLEHVRSLVPRQGE